MKKLNEVFVEYKYKAMEDVNVFVYEEEKQKHEKGAIGGVD